MSSLSETYRPFFELFTQPAPYSRFRADVVYFMGIDAEWHEELGRNIVLSYQIATLSSSTYNNIIKFVPKGERLKLADLIELGIKSVHGGRIPHYRHSKGAFRVHVVIVSHNVAAEWSVLADRDEPYITKRLALIRRSPITDIHAIQVLIDRQISARVWLFDTMLLAPATHQSLKALSGLLGKDDQKISISQRHIENMHLFLNEDPEAYKRYALKDSEACLKLFLLLQDSLNKLVFTRPRKSIDGEALEQAPTTYHPEKLFLTLASAGVLSFEKHLSFLPKNHLFRKRFKNFSGYQEALQCESFAPHLELAKRGYLGGRNESFFVGDTDNFDLSSDRLWIDIDFSSCYPTAMALYPTIDPLQLPLFTSPGYKLDEIAVAQLLEETIPAPLIQAAQAALQESEAKFLGTLDSVKLKKHARRIKELAQVVDNSLIDRWQRISSGQLRVVDADPDEFVIPGFARVRFKFPEGTLFPSLPIKHPQFGLIYPLEGDTVATASEILLALEQGAKIESLYSVEFPMLVDGRNRPYRLFAKHLAKVVQDRKSQKMQIDDKSLPEEKRNAASVLEKLLKEFVNGLYGKTAQAINPRRVYRPNKRTMVPLGPSTISEPIVAALTTGLARAALSASLAAIERYNHDKPVAKKIVTISATTDGFLVGVPKPRNLDTRENYYQAGPNGNLRLKEGVDQGLRNLLAKCGCGCLIDEMVNFLPNRQMWRGRGILTGKKPSSKSAQLKVETFLEIKHLADRIISIKTRGQIGLLSDGSIPLLAKFGHKPPLSDILTPDEYRRVMDTGGSTRNKEDGAWLIKQLEKKAMGEGDLGSYHFFTLTSFRSMIDSDGALDMTQKRTEKRINVDYDWKRYLPKDSPITLPHPTMRAMKIFRNQMEAIRRSGRSSDTLTVHQRVAIKGRITRFRGGELVTLVRHFLTGVLQGHLSTAEPLPSYTAVAADLNLLWQKSGYNGKYNRRWSASDLKNAKVREWEPGLLPRTLAASALLGDLCALLKADPEAVGHQLFISTHHENYRLSLLLQVIRSVLLAPRQGIEPFRSFHLAGKLPGRQGLLTLFTPMLTKELIAHCDRGTFELATCPPYQAPHLVNIFRKLGLSNTEASACAQVIAPPQPTKKSRTNRIRKNCLDSFVLALAQSDLPSSDLNSRDIISRLASFGLSRDGYYRARKGKFIPNSLANTPENRQQLRRMAQRLKLSPAPFLETLIDG